jgi:hypothetical protein
MTSAERTAAKAAAKTKKQQGWREDRAYKRSVGDQAFIQKEQTFRDKYTEFTRLARQFAKHFPEQFEHFKTALSKASLEGRPVTPLWQAQLQAQLATYAEQPNAANLIIHGVWAMLDNVMPISISYKISSDTGHVVGEPFDLERLQAVGRQCIKVKNVLEGLSKRLRPGSVSRV